MRCFPLTLKPEPRKNPYYFPLYCLFNSIMVYYNAKKNGEFFIPYIPLPTMGPFFMAHLNFLVMHMMHHPSLTPQKPRWNSRVFGIPHAACHSLALTRKLSSTAETTGKNTVRKFSRHFQLTQRNMSVLPSPLLGKFL